MKALSIQQPWAWLIVKGIKDIENRDWTIDYRGIILIHAGKKPDAGFRFETILPRLEKVDAFKFAFAQANFDYGGIVGYATLVKVVTESDSPWFVGKYGFMLTHRHPVPFMPLRGHLGLFDVPAEIEAEINRIRDERAWEEDMKDMEQIKQEWYEYRHAGDETPPWK